MKESPLFVKSYETLVWVLRHTEKFPKSQRFVMARRMQDAMPGLHDALMTATVVHRNVQRERARQGAPATQRGSAG